jgi:hypothetical protein
VSKDGQWRPFPKVPHLLQYVSNGNYYGRIEVGGKIIRESLKTGVWTTAKLRLTDLLKELQEDGCERPERDLAFRSPQWLKDCRLHESCENHSCPIPRRSSHAPPGLRKRHSSPNEACQEGEFPLGLSMTLGSNAKCSRN